MNSLELCRRLERLGRLQAELMDTESIADCARELLQEAVEIAGAIGGNLALLSGYSAAIGIGRESCCCGQGDDPAREAGEAKTTLPLRIGAQTIGEISLFFDPHRTLSEEQRPVMAIVAQQCALTLERTVRLSQARSAQVDAVSKQIDAFESMTDAFVALDRDGNLIYVNREAERLLERSREGLIGKRVWEEFPEALGAGLRPDYERAAAEGITLTVERFYAPRNTWWEARLYPSASGLSVYFRDITEIKQAQEERIQARLQQRAFLRDVLYSVTEGKLRLCETEADLPARLPEAGEPIPLTSSTLAEVRRQVRETTALHGFSEERAMGLMSAASECAMNAVQHAGVEATALLCAFAASSDTEGTRIQVWITDQGRGMDLSELPKATLMKGYSGDGGFGHGFFLMLQSVDAVYLLTRPQSGTTVVLEQGLVPADPLWLAKF